MQHFPPEAQKFNQTTANRQIINTRGFKGKNVSENQLYFPFIMSMNQPHRIQYILNNTLKRNSFLERGALIPSPYSIAGNFM